MLNYAANGHGLILAAWNATLKPFIEIKLKDSLESYSTVDESNIYCFH